jgi:SET domain-containing protein
MKRPTKSKTPRKSKVSHHAHMRTASHVDGVYAPGPLFEVRRSKIHGRGVYALRRIPKGTRIVEYLGERISHAVADARYEAQGKDDGHTFLFVVDDETCIDAGVKGNAARFINHGCDANCETEIEGGRVFIDARRDIEPGEELGYDYSLTWVSTDDPAELALYACRCGSSKCRGTMLDPEALDQKQAKRRKKRKRGTR